MPRQAINGKREIMADLAAGLQLVKTRLAAIGLLAHVKIGYADLDAKTWRVFYPELEAGA